MNQESESNLSRPQRHGFLRRHAALFLICCVFFVVGLLRLNDYSFLTPDSSLYLIWGNSVAHGQGFVDNTQPIPDRFVSRGVLYSILLAPIEVLFPHSLTAAKIFTLFCGVLALILFYFWLHRKLGQTGAVVGTLFLACNPLVLIYGTEVLSEIPFLCFVLIACVLMERLVDFPDGNDAVWTGFALGLCLAAVGLIRDIGMAFLLTSVFFLFVLRRGKQILPVVMVNILFLGLWFVRNKYLVHQTGFSQTGYLPWFLSHVGTPESARFSAELWWRISTSGSVYLPQFGGTLLYPLFATRQFASLLPSVPHPYAALEAGFPLWSRFVVAVALPLLIFGVFRDVRNHRSGWYRIGSIILYLGIVLCFPFNDIRYHVPLLPFFIYYIINGSAFVGEYTGSIRKVISSSRILGFAAVCMIPNVLGIMYLLSNNMTYMRAPTQPWPAMGAWITAHTPGDAVIACPVKDLAPEIGNRKLINIDPSIDRPEFEKILRDNSVSCIITPLLAEGGTTYEFNMAESGRFGFDTLHTTGALIAWSVHNTLLGPGSNHTIVADQSERHTPVIEARKAIRAGEYDRALKLLSPIAATQPDRADVFYQMLIASSLLHDTNSVTRLYNTIVSLPSWSGIYIAPAKRHMSALRTMIALKQSRGIGSPLRATEAAAMYWRLGYSALAMKIMNEFTLPDSTYFVGLLWGMHYNLQCGDTVSARKYIRLLKSIDKSNAVVVAFDSVFRIIDRLASDTSAGDASQSHLDVANIYRAMELREEAIDEAERAIALDPQNEGAMVFLGQMFEATGKYQTAARWYSAARAISESNAEAQSGSRRVDGLLKAQLEE